MRVQERIPRQWFFDEVRPGWVRNTSLVLDEMTRVVEELKDWRSRWPPRRMALNRIFGELETEYQQLKFKAVRSDRLLSQDIQVEADLSRKLYPNSPVLWKKKKE